MFTLNIITRYTGQKFLYNVRTEKGEQDGFLGNRNLLAGLLIDITISGGPMSDSADVKSSQVPDPWIRFHCRLKTDVYRFFRHVNRRFSRNCLQVIHKYMRGVRGGRITLDRRSSFYSRPDRSDKVECWLKVRESDKEWLETVSFSLRMSQAELVRMALDWWLALHSNHGSIDEYDASSWYHEIITCRPIEVVFTFWGRGIVLIRNFPSMEEVRDGLAVTTAA